MATYRTLFGDFVMIPSGVGLGDMVTTTYDPNGVEADAFNTANHSDTVTTITSNTTLAAKTKYYNNSASNLTHTLPAAAVGKWCFVFKGGSGNIRINRAGADTIVDATSTYIENTTAGDEDTAYLCLYCYTAGLWSIQEIMRTWAYA